MTSKKMKKHIIISAILSVMALTGCDNYLDIVPKGESVLNSTDDYLGLLEDMNGFPVGDEWYLSGEGALPNMADMENYKYPTTSAVFFWNENYDRAQYKTATGTSDMYSECYRRIAKFNVVIDNMNDAKGSSEDKLVGIAQAKVLRAYNYFYLINTYAKPYSKATAEQDRGIILRSSFNLEKEGVQSTVADAYRLIESDINEALSALPAKTTTAFRPNKAFGYALKAKVHLVKTEFAAALAASLNAIEEGESKGGNKVWDMNADYSNLITNLSNMYGGADEELFEFGGPFYNMITSMSSMYFKHGYEDPENLLYAHGLNFMSPSPQMVRKPIIDLFDMKTDLRFVLEYMKMQRPTSEAGAYPWMASNISHNVGGIKLSEVYLMAAECYARQGDVPNSMKYLNALRSKRVMTKYYADAQAADAGEALTLVRNERKRELVLTSNGYFDMRRFCTEFKENLTRQYKDETYTLKYDSHLLTFPFPVAAMQNSNLIQNSK